MTKGFNRTSLILALFILCITANSQNSFAEESSIEINLDILSDEAPKDDEEDKPQDLFESKIDKITAEAKAKVEAAIDTKKHVLKPKISKKDYSITKPSSSYSSGKYVSPYKSIYDDPYSYKRKKYTPPKPTVNTYESYLEKYRKHSKGYKPYLSDSWKKRTSPYSKSKYVKKPEPKPYVPTTSYTPATSYTPERSYATDRYQAPAPKAVPVTPVTTAPAPIVARPAPKTEAPKIVTPKAVAKPKTVYKPLEDYKAPDTTQITEPNNTTEIVAPKLDSVERESIKQNIFKSMDTINKIAPPIKRPELVTEEATPKTIANHSNIDMMATNGKYKLPDAPAAAEAALYEASKDISESTAPSIFNNRVNTKKQTAITRSADAQRQAINPDKIILDRNIPLGDDIIPDITKATKANISKVNEAIADTDITEKLAISKKAKNLPVARTIAAKNMPVREISKVTAKAPTIDSTNKYTNQPKTKIVTKKPEAIKQVTKPAISRKQSKPIKEITKPNIYAQKANESMGLNSGKYSNITKNISKKISNGATKLASVDTKSTIAKAQSVLKDISTNVSNITEKAAEATKRTTSNVKNTITKELKKKNIIELEPKETLVSLTFDENTSKLTDALKAELDSTAEFLKQSPNIRVQIQAYSHSANKTKSDARRMSLSRGLVVRSYLTEKGIKPVRLDIRALGDNVAEGTVADRVDIVFLD